MTSDNTSTLIQLLLHLEKVTPLQYKNLLAFRNEKGEGKLKEHLLTKNLVTSQGLEKLMALLARGYYYCSLCPQVYPAPGPHSKSQSCPKCKEIMSFYQSRTSHPTGVLPLIDEGDTEEGSSRTPPASSHQKFKDKGERETIEVSPPKEYEILGVLGQGGHGLVYQVAHPLTGRKMALKVLRKEAAGKGRIQRRFLREIKVTSLLEHPNIMPLYECGYLKEGSLYFIMKELRGGTFKDMIEAYHKGGGDAPSLEELLEVLLIICHAIDYAHSEGVIHRDLKPSNVAVGSFGEVMVLDWGIARVAGRKEEVMEEEGRTEMIEVRGETMTLQGMVGTPGYMAPEQARGGKTSEKSDIHALGAILYQILTGEIPYSGSVQQRLVNLLMNPIEEPEKRCPHKNIPPELSAMAMKALEKKPFLRYENVAHFHEDIHRYLTGFSVSARRDSLLLRSKKWVQRNRMASLSMVGVFLAALITGGFLYLIYSQQIQRDLENHRRRADKLLKEMDLSGPDRLVKRFPSSYQKGESESPRAQRIRQRAIKEYLKVRRVLEEALKLAPDSKEIRDRLFEVVENTGKLALLGRNFLLAETSFERAYELDREKGSVLLASVDQKREEQRVAHKERIEEILAGLKKSPPRPRMIREYANEIVRMGTPEVVKLLLGYLESENLWVRSVVIEALGKLGDVHSQYEGRDPVEWLMKRLKDLHVKKDEGECIRIIWALGRLRDSRANTLVGKKRTKSGAGSLLWRKTAIPFSWLPERKDEGEKKPEEWRREAVWKMDKGKYKEALEDINRALAAKGDDGIALMHRSNIYRELGELKKAFRDIERAADILPKNYNVYYFRGRLHRDFGRIKEAIRDFKKALELNPREIRAHHGLAKIHSNLRHFEKSLEAYNQTLKLDPQYAQAYINRGLLYMKLKKYEKALADLNQGLGLNPRLSLGFANRGLLYMKMGKTKKAFRSFQRALEINPRDPNVYLLRANSYVKLKKYKEALADYNRALTLDPKHINSRLNRGNLLFKLGKNNEALADYKKGISLHPHYMQFHYNAGFVLKKLKKYKEAIGYFTRALEINEDYKYGYYNRGLCYKMIGEREKAIRDFENFLKLAPRNSHASKARAWLEEMRD